MAISKPSLITIPALVPSTALTALLLSPKKRPTKRFFSRATYIVSLWGILIAGFGVLSMFVFLSRWHPGDENCNNKATSTSSFFDNGGKDALDRHRDDLAPSTSKNFVLGNLTNEERDFWQQPDDQGYKPCLKFSDRYGLDSSRILSDRRNYLVVVVSGGLNQQRNQIVDAVVIARILGAALVVPIMQVNVIWGDDSEFSDIFDFEHFKTSLQADVRIVTSLPSTHIGTRPAEEKRTPLNASPEWFKQHYSKRLRRDGILLLRGLDSRLSKDLPADLQKLRCKVAFHALRFAAPIQALGDQITQRMWSQGPYLALHLRLEKDVWVRTGCLPGLGPEHDEEIRTERRLNPKLLTGRSNMTQEERQLAGLCPLTAKEVARLLRGLGATSWTRIYWAGGEPFGGSRALQPLKQEFPNLVNKHDIATPQELEAFRSKASRLAAIDYVVSLNSDVFMPSHGGNMGHALKGHRAYTGHRKHITPNKREMLPFFLNSSLPQRDFNAAIRELHRESVGQPAMWMEKKGRDVLGYPVAECMCKTNHPS
ncbi:O-fucosyltransferase 20 [Selaginella moellendorffii]|nr:O-fucosyltransferase 20 [Selaginella moellendorffii]|eukprot:XP_002965190.2 O-fucosyltransferase 20 [Selaginella moellendorffii]